MSRREKRSLFVVKVIFECEQKKTSNTPYTVPVYTLDFITADELLGLKRRFIFTLSCCSQLNMSYGWSGV